MIALEPHTQAVLTRLATVTFGTPAAALKVGDAVAPKSAAGAVVAPCAVVYGRDGGTLESSVGCLDTDGSMPLQVTSVGRSAAEARTVADKCSAALTGSNLTVAGRWCRVRRPSPTSRVERDDTITPPLFYVTTIYRLLTLSAT